MNAVTAVEAVRVDPQTEQGITTLEAWAKTLVIRNADEHAYAVETLKGVKAWRGKIVDFFAESKEAAHKAWKGIVANEKSFTDRLDFVEQASKRAILKYQQEQERLLAEQQRQAQAEADEKARKERERLEKEAAKLKTPELRQAKLEAAAAVVAPVIQIASPVEKPSGVATRKTWKARVVNVDAVPREYMLVNEKALAAIATSTKGSIKVPGVEFYVEESLAVGGR